MAHIKGNWELTWDHDRQIYEPEEESFSSIVNDLINELSTATPPIAYHNNEDSLAEFCKANLNWDIKKFGVRWTGSDYVAILEQGGFSDRNQRNLILAARGRIQAAPLTGAKSTLTTWSSPTKGCWLTFSQSSCITVPAMQHEFK